jgi:hypothetical protein
MKADVFLARFAPSQLDLPSWLPEPIAEWIRADYAGFVEAACEAACRECGYSDIGDDRVPRKYFEELIRNDHLRASIADFIRDYMADVPARYLPLACDHRMERVWWELRRPSSGEFYYPALVSSAANAKERQDNAMLELFITAFACRQRPRATTTRREIEQQRNHYLDMANKLRDDARIMLNHVDLSFEMKRPLALETSAQAYEDYAREVCAENFGEMALERQRDGEARWVALTIGSKFRTLFGESMYGSTATITSVVIDREINTQTVRKWLGRLANN